LRLSDRLVGVSVGLIGHPLSLRANSRSTSVAFAIEAWSVPPQSCAVAPPRLPSSLCSSKNLVQAFLPLLDQPLGGRDDFLGQEFEQVVLIGEADGLQHTLLYEEVSKHRPVFTFLLAPMRSALLRFASKRFASKKVRLKQVRLAEVRPAEVLRLAEVRAGEVRPAEARPPEVRPAEVRSADRTRSPTSQV
jgi:hypothetical protein